MYILNRFEILLKSRLSGLNVSRVFLRSRIAESAVGPFFVVIPSPLFDLFPGAFLP